MTEDGWKKQLKKAKDNMKVNSFNRVIKEEKKLFKEDL